MQIYGMFDIIPTLVKKLEEKLMIKLTLYYNHWNWVAIFAILPWALLLLLLLIT
jgi:hypothetical protein